MRVFACLLVLLGSAETFGQCPGGVCQFISKNASYEWRSGSVQTEAYLYANGWQVGGYSYDQDVYRPWLGDRYGEPAKPPVAPPKWESWQKVSAQVFGQDVTPANNFGIDTAKLSSRIEPKYICNGEPCSRETAVKAIEKGLPDDGKKLYLTVIGADEDRKRAEADFPPDFKSRVKLNSYRSDHWAVQPGFVTAGTPTVYLQAPDGKVLHRQDNYSPGDFQAIRKAIDRYDAKRDPDVRQASAPVSLPAFATPANLILGGLIAAVVALYFKQRKATI